MVNKNRFWRPGIDGGVPMIHFLFVVSIGLAAVLIPFVSADLAVNPHSTYIPRAGNRGTISISVTADTDGNYTVTLKERPYFDIVSESSVTKFIYKGDTMRMDFTVLAKNGTEDGTYPFEYTVYRNGTQVSEGSVKVYVGRGGGESCTSIMLVGGVLIGLVAVTHMRRVRR